MPPWPEERKQRARETRRRNRRLKQLGELVLIYPLFWREEAIKRGYGDLVDQWNGQFKKRKKKPKVGSNSEKPATLYHLDSVTGAIRCKRVQESRSTRSLPPEYLKADYVCFVAFSRMGNVKTMRMDCSMIPTVRDYERIYRQFARKYPSVNGYTIAGIAFLKFVHPEKFELQVTP